MLKCFCFGATLASVVLAGGVLSAQQQQYDRVDARQNYSRSQYNQGTGYFQQRSGQPTRQSWSSSQAPNQPSRRYYDQEQQYGQRFESFGSPASAAFDQQAGLGVSLSGQADQGVLITRVHRDSPAERAGLEPGDEIVAIDERQVVSPEQVIERIRQARPGEVVIIHLQRDGQEESVRARLESRREAIARQAWNWREAEGQQSQRGEPRSQRLMLHQVERLSQTVHQLGQEIDALRNQLQQTESAYRGIESRRTALREQFEQGRQERQEGRQERQESRQEQQEERQRQQEQRQQQQEREQRE